MVKKEKREDEVCKALNKKKRAIREMKGDEGGRKVGGDEERRCETEGKKG